MSTVHWRGVSLLTAASFLLLAGCVVPPPPEPPPPAPVVLNTEVYAYPQHDQSPDQQGRDRYECSLWATRQTGFDPSAANVPPAYRVHVAGPPSGAGTAIGAITGAIIGAAVGGPRSGPGPALVGAVAGAAVGSAADAENAQGHVEYVQDRRAIAAMQRRAGSYRRAVGACLEGRGYSVQ